MKQFYTNIKKRTGVFALSLLMIGALVSCDTTGLTDTLDEFGVVVELEPINTSATVLLYDAQTGELIEDNVTITYSGDNGDQVIDVFSDPISSSEVSDGILGFGISNSVVPSESSPAGIRLIIEANGYIGKARTIQLTQEGKNEFEVELVRENNKPQGLETATSTAGQADAQGAIQTDFTVTSNAENDDASGTTIEVESGTIFKDANGNTLTGQLTSSVTYFDPKARGAMSSIPVDLTLDESGELMSVMGGSTVSIKDAQGNEAASTETTAKIKSVSNHGMTFVFKIPPDINNVFTQQPYKAGDTAHIIKIDSDYNVSTSNLIVVDLGSNTFGVRYTTAEIPKFVAVYQRVTSELKCTSGINVIRNGVNGNLILDLFRTGFNLPLSINAGANATANSNWYMPKNDLDITISSSIGTTNLSGVNICENSTITLPEPPANVIDAQINVDLVCKNGGVVSTTDLPGASVVYRKAGSANRWRSANNIQFRTNAKGTALQGGSFNVSNVEQGPDYNFKINFDGETFNKIISVTGTEVTTNYEIDDDDVCVVN